MFSFNLMRGGNDNEWNVVQNTTKYKQQNYTIDQFKSQGFLDSSSVTILCLSSKWTFPTGRGKNSSFTSNNTFNVLNDDKKSTHSQLMSSRSTSRKPVISEFEEKQRMLSDLAMMPQFAQTIPSLNPTNSTNVPKEAVVEHNVVELDPEIADLINLKCKNIIQEYEQMHNLEDIIYSLTEDVESKIRTRHEEFVKTTCLITLDSSPKSRTEAGKLFAELLSKKVISMAAVTQGIDGVLKDWNDYLMDYPQFFSYIAAIITPLLISKTASFEFCNLKDACASIHPDNSSTFLIEVLQKILSSKETQNIEEQTGTKPNTSQGKAASKTEKPNTIHMSPSLREEVKLHQIDRAWVPTAVKKAAKSESTRTKNEEEMKTDEVNKSVRSILNKITPVNKKPLTKRFKSLPIDTIERLEKTVDLVFEKAIEEQSFAPLCASICSAMQNVQVSCGEGDATTSFKKLIISKCQSLFQQDKAQELDSAKKFSEINSCKDPEKKKELQLEYKENERRLHKRSVGNCRFIGELYKHNILTAKIMLYCIMDLVTQHVEEPLECLCNLLKTVGKKLDNAYNLNEIFDKLKALTSKEMKSKIPSRIRFMIQDVIDLRRDKWIPRRVDSKPKLINEIENDAKNEAVEQSMALSYRPEKRDHHQGDDKFRGGDSKSRRKPYFII